jgi:hypothetical protein
VLLALDLTFSHAPLTRLTYTGDLQADLLAIVRLYHETNEQLGELFVTLLAEVPRSPELAPSLDTLMANIDVVRAILERYQAEGRLKPEPVLNVISALIGPWLIARMIHRANPDLPIPELDPQQHVAAFLHGRKA